MIQVIQDFVLLTRKAMVLKPSPIPSIGYYSPFFFLSHICYVCLQLRASAGILGLKWWRSLILGFAFSQFPCFLYCWLSEIPEGFSDVPSIIWHYLVIWCSFNLFPFDLVTRFFGRSICALTLYLAAAMAQGD